MNLLRRRWAGIASSALNTDSDVSGMICAAARLVFVSAVVTELCIRVVKLFASRAGFRF